ncbi:MAG TPA: hypothetical protein VFQ65_33485 [Kofleriaceae bacterium]|nr:hypothetical protein [Kofleriaceae bacterium]
MKAFALVALVMTVKTAAAAPDPAAPDPAAPDPAAPAQPPDPGAPDPAASDPAAPPRFAPPSLAPLVVPVAHGETEPPPLDGGRLVIEVVGGGGIGFVGLVLGAFAGAGLECANGCPGDFGGLGGAILGGAVGGVLGIGVGVYLVGNYGDQTGSFGATIGGAVLGATAGGLLAAGMASEGRSFDSAATIVAVAGPFVGGMIGFNLTRRWDRPAAAPAIGSLVRFDRGTWRAGVPIVAPSASGSYLSIASGSF